MGSLPGDLLRILVGQGMHAGANILGQMITEPMKEKRDVKRQVAGKLLESMPYVPQEGQAAIASKFKELTNIDWPTYQGPTGNVIGQGGERMAMTPVAGAPVAQEMGTRYVAPPPDMNKIMGMIAQKNPQFVENILNQRGGGMTEVKEAMLGQRERETELKRYLGEMASGLKERDVAMREQMLPYKMSAITSAAEARLNKIELESLKFELKKKESESKEKTAAEKQLETLREHYNKQLVDYLKIVKDENADPEVKWKAAGDYNTLLKTLPENVAPLMKHHSPFDLKETERLGGYIKPKREIKAGPSEAATPEATKPGEASWTHPRPYHQGSYSFCF